MKSVEFIKEFIAARKKWDSILATFQEDDFIKPGVIAGMSLKDLIAHIAWYEEQMVELLSTRLLTGSELWNLKDDERNLAIHEIYMDRELDKVQAESKKINNKLFEELNKLTDDELVNPGNFEGMPEDWVPWKLIAGNSIDHYQHHYNDLENWYTFLYE